MNIDRKFNINAVNPATGKVYTQNNSILLVAKDKALIPTLTYYLEQCRHLGSNPEHLESIGLLIDRVREFQLNEGCKTPDTVGDEIARCIHGEGL